MQTDISGKVLYIPAFVTWPCSSPFSLSCLKKILDLDCCNFEIFHFALSLLPLHEYIYIFLFGFSLNTLSRDIFFFVSFT